MTLLRLYLQFFNSGAAWTVYATRNQNLTGDLQGDEVQVAKRYKNPAAAFRRGRLSSLSIPSPDVETHYNPPRQEKASNPRRDGQSPYMKYFNPDFTRDYLARKYGK
jgi:hypothetical protein